MGAQQGKPEDSEDIIEICDQQQNDAAEREPEETVMAEQNLIVGSDSQQRITVANFAKIKEEPKEAEEETDEQQLAHEKNFNKTRVIDHCKHHQNRVIKDIGGKSNQFESIENLTTEISKISCPEENPVAIPNIYNNIEVKRELLASRRTEKEGNGSDFSSLTTDSIISSIKKEKLDSDDSKTESNNSDLILMNEELSSNKSTNNANITIKCERVFNKNSKKVESVAPIISSIDKQTTETLQSIQIPLEEFTVNTPGVDEQHKTLRTKKPSLDSMNTIIKKEPSESYNIESQFIKHKQDNPTISNNTVVILSDVETSPYKTRKKLNIEIKKEPEEIVENSLNVFETGSANIQKEIIEKSGSSSIPKNTEKSSDESITNVTQVDEQNEAFQSFTTPILSEKSSKEIDNIVIKEELLKSHDIESQSNIYKQTHPTLTNNTILISTDDEISPSKTRKVVKATIKRKRVEVIKTTSKNIETGDAANFVGDIDNQSQKYKQTEPILLNNTILISDEGLSPIKTRNNTKAAVKREHLEDIENNSEETIQNFLININPVIKPENSDEIFVDNALVQPLTEKRKFIEKVDTTIPLQSSTLVRNPLAFLKRSCGTKLYRKNYDVSEDKNQEEYLNKNIKCERKQNPESLTILEAEAIQPSINLNELIIKSDSPHPPKDNLDFYHNNHLNVNCLSPKLNSSLDVNLSNVDTDFEENLSIHSNENLKSNISINSSQESLKYFSIIELSSVENGYSPVKQTTVAIKKIPESPKVRKSFKRRSYKTRQVRKALNNKRKLQYLNQKNKPGRKAKNKSRAYTEKDSPFKSCFSKKNVLKNLPKTGIKTRKKVSKTNANKNTPNKEDFPKPLKVEPITVAKYSSAIAMELPKPMTFKKEIDTNNNSFNIKNTKIYLNPEFQPYVRIKRLKSEELLVPLKTNRYVRKTRKCLNYPQLAKDNRRDFRIQHAFSLNQRTKLNRLSLDQDHQLYFNSHNEQASLYSRLTTPYSLANDTSNESLAETDSKYFSPQELYSLFNSSTPDASSEFSGHIDSGVSTSTPSMLQQHHQQHLDRSLLLEIAAERAFINNHLVQFGYSPIQFDLYNNVNNLNIYLKYLLGSANMN